MISPHRNHPLWFAFLLHRLSGIGLALFLPAHFFLLSQALNDTAALDRALAWTEHPLTRLAEFGLVFLLAVHLGGGLRLLAVEFLPWSPRQRTFAALVTAVSFLVACGFLLRAV